MNYFIVKEDFYTVYTSENFDLLTGSDDTIWQKALPKTIEDAKGYLRSRYDVTSIFSTIQIETDDSDVTATINQRIYQSTSEKFYYCIKAATTQLLTNTTYFEERDDRNPKLVEVIVDMLIYNMMPRLNNIDIPVIRNERYDGNRATVFSGAIGWLNKVNVGKIQPDLPLRYEGQQDQTGNKIISGFAEEVTAKNRAF